MDASCSGKHDLLPRDRALLPELREADGHSTTDRPGWSVGSGGRHVDPASTKDRIMARPNGGLHGAED